ncbi:uncharacterized protein PV09_06989 [Verruconis gallopava]|uniref:PRISE-like Rossmann-fold domain-containing protein n=1 Tax=Verruconis gallopava TaxID=253628 RepID=A0A0D1XH46_9PEZI|nr:uncharacterized protein PV09_06989 [Verruconis gallopava]KIW01511.1 hypothetical protein PV09_06989 [Verruconis gallopava]
MSSEMHALVFGASGVSGWGVMNQLLSYPTPTAWTSIAGTTNRPLTASQALLPNDPRLSLVSGIDLTNPPSAIAKSLKEKVKHVDKITHVFFTAYIHINERAIQLLEESSQDHELVKSLKTMPEYKTKNWHALVKETNVKIVKNASEALNEVAPSLKRFVMQTGGKHYGMDSGPKLVPSLLDSPYEESRPRLTGKVAEPIFYYGQIDAVADSCRDRSWTFCEVRPDVIVGFVPSLGSVSGQDAARLLALYLSLYRKVHGEGAEFPFPGSQKSWTNRHTDSWQDTIGKLSIWAATQDLRNGEAFNCVDKPTTWKEKWGPICAFFGLKGTGPGERPYDMMQSTQWVHQHKKEIDELIKEHGLIGDSWTTANWVFMWAIMTVLDYDKEYDMRKATGLGFKDQVGGADGWIATFKRLREAKVIP